jgi:hypothetical protein
MSAVSENSSYDDGIRLDACSWDGISFCDLRNVVFTQRTINGLFDIDGRRSGKSALTVPFSDRVF